MRGATAPASIRFDGVREASLHQVIEQTLITSQMEYYPVTNDSVVLLTLTEFICHFKKIAVTG
jgi:hypothetical protein